MAFAIDYSNLFRSLSGRYIVVLPDDPKFTIVEESEAHAVIGMVNRDDVIGKPLLEAFPDTSPKFKKTGVSDLLESFRRVAKSGKPETMAAFRYDLKNQDGKMEEHYWRVTHYPVLASDGSVELIFQATENITSEILAGNRLARAERQLEEALSVGSIGTWAWDFETNKIIADKNLSALFGVTEQAGKQGLPLHILTDSIHPDDKARITKAIDKTVKKKGSFEEEYRTTGRNGDLRWVIARGRIETDNSGRAVSFPGVIVDITDRKIAENNTAFLSKASTLLSSSLDYNTTLKSIAKLIVPTVADWCSVDIYEESSDTVKPVALAHKDPGKVKWAKELRKQYPVNMDDAGGIPNVLRTGTTEFYPEITPEMLAMNARDENHATIISEIGMSSAIVVPLKINTHTIGAITLVIAEQKRHFTKADLEMATELANRASLAMTNSFLYKNAQDELRKREQLEDELREANEKLETRVRQRTAQLEATNTNLKRSNQELQDFAYVASHDLQEPLRKIQAFGDLLQNEYSERLGDGRDYLNRMRSAASRMSVLIEDLLAFSRVTTKAREFSPVDLQQVATEVLGDLEARVRDTDGIVLIGNLPTIQADPIQMRQLFQNLIGNALKFHKPGEPPKVQVNAVVKKSANDGREYCRIRIKDNGVGFDEKYLDRIFAVFQRLHGRESYEGTGIGLAVCRKIVERHDGEITAKSQTNTGSTFIVTLPVRHRKTEKTPHDK